MTGNPRQLPRLLKNVLQVGGTTDNYDMRTMHNSQEKYTYPAN